MGSTEVRREKAVLLKLAIFIVLFFASSILKDQLMPLRIETRLSIFNRYHVEESSLVQFFQTHFYFRNTQEFMVLLFRILLSSFVKDMIIAACSPSIFDSPISTRLIKKLECAPLDASWIPETDHQRRLNFEREKLKHENGANLNPTINSVIDADGHTFIYALGHTSVEKSTQFCHESAKQLVRGLQLIRSLVEDLLSKCISVVVFSIRSIVCTISSVFLLVLYSFQLVLRLIKIIYLFMEWMLMYACSCINDISLLTVEVINESSLSNGEDIYTNLKESVEKLHDEPSIENDSFIPKPEVKTSAKLFGALKFW